MQCEGFIICTTGEYFIKNVCNYGSTVWNQIRLACSERTRHYQTHRLGGCACSMLSHLGVCVCGVTMTQSDLVFNHLFRAPVGDQGDIRVQQVYARTRRGITKLHLKLHQRWLLD